MIKPWTAEVVIVQIITRLRSTALNPIHNAVCTIKLTKAKEKTFLKQIKFAVIVVEESFIKMVLITHKMILSFFGINGGPQQEELLLKQATMQSISHQSCWLVIIFSVI